jgi:hypothetical protein
LDGCAGAEPDTTFIAELAWFCCCGAIPRRFGVFHWIRLAVPVSNLRRIKQLTKRDTTQLSLGEKL